MPTAIQAIGPSHWLPRDRKSAIQRSINLYPAVLEGGEASPVLMSAPGLVLTHDFGAQVRGMIAAGSRLLVVAGATLYEWTGTAAEVLGTLATSSGDVSMAWGQGQVCIVDGPTGYVLNLESGELAPITSAGWLGSRQVEALDGYFIFVEPATERFYISAIDDASSLDALDFSSADTQPDEIIAHAVVGQALYLMGSRGIELWVNSGGADFPFSRFQGAPIDAGVAGRNAWARTSAGLAWVGQSPMGGPYVYAMSGYTPQRISTRAVEAHLSESTDLASARVWSYQDAGAEFVAVQAPGMETTWVYDLASRSWHERGELVGGLWAQSRITRHAYHDGAHYVTGGPRLYRMSSDAYTLAGDPLVRERTWSHLTSPAYEPVRYHQIDVRCTTGEGGAMTLEISNDGGAVYGTPLRRDLGAIGRRAHRVRWGPLGACPAGSSRVHRLRVSDAVPLTIHEATIA